MLFRSLVIGTIFAAGAFAQLTSFPKPSYFRETFFRTEPKVELKGPIRLQDFLQGDKLELTLKDYLKLVMANNTDIQIQMLSVEVPKDAIMRAMATWDPLAQASFNNQMSKSPSTTALAGAATVVSRNQPASFSYQQTLPAGTLYTVSFAGSKSDSNNAFSTFNPALSSTVGVTLSQPLIKNRGTYVNRLNLMMARSKYRKSDYDLRNNLLQMVNTAENAYWDVVQSRENLRVAESARDVADQFLKLNQKELDLGALSPLDIYNPQQQLANAELTVAQAKFNLIQKEDALRRQIGADLDPKIRTLPMVLTETVELPLDSIAVDREASVSKALAARPDLKSAMQNLDVDDLQIRQAKNGLLPDLELTGQYTAQGRGGVAYLRSSVFGTGPGASSVVTTLPGGFADSLSQMFGFGFPIYAFGLNLRLPIKNHSAAADMADAVVGKKRDALTVRTTQQQIRLDVLTAASSVEGSKEQLKLAKIALDLSKKNLDAENQKYELGTEINQNVIQAQNVLVQAESNLVINQISLQRNLLNLLTKTGELLDERGIVIP
jgi:outer membrane protein TolC